MAIAAATVVEAIAIRRKQLFILLMVGAVCLGTSQSVQAQCTAKNEAFQSGEHVMYDLYFNWKFIWKKVGSGKPHYQCHDLPFRACISL